MRLFSGRYPHNNHVEGFYQVPNPGYPVMTDIMKSAGYFTAIRHKVGHSTPYTPYAWDLVLDRLVEGGQVESRDPATFKTTTAKGIAAAKAAGKPFCLVMNIADPHKPFYSEGRGRNVRDPNEPSRIFKPNEVPIPGYLFDDPVVRTEMSALLFLRAASRRCRRRRAQALEESGQADHTIVIFLSDHGMGMPFVKTQLYHRSTQTPLIVRWPEVTKAGAVDREHLVSAVDFLPTLLDMVGIKHPDGLDGRSFEPCCMGSRKKVASTPSRNTTKTPADFATPCGASNRSDFCTFSILGPMASGECAPPRKVRSRMPVCNNWPRPTKRWRTGSMHSIIESSKSCTTLKKIQTA